MTNKFRSHKACIFGIQESGKTHWARTMYKHFKRPIVYSVNDDDGWKQQKGIVVWEGDIKNVRADFKKFVSWVQKLAREGKIDLIIVDEADMVLQGNWDIDDDMGDLVLNHRHMGSGKNKGVALWFLTRRPQDIPTKIVESSKHLIIFKLEGKNAIDRFSEIHPDIPRLIKKVSYEKHNFVYKELGKEPVMHKPL